MPTIDYAGRSRSASIDVSSNFYWGILDPLCHYAKSPQCPRTPSDYITQVCISTIVEPTKRSTSKMRDATSQRFLALFEPSCTVWSGQSLNSAIGALRTKYVWGPMVWWFSQKPLADLKVWSFGSSAVGTAQSETKWIEKDGDSRRLDSFPAAGQDLTDWFSQPGCNAHLLLQRRLGGKTKSIRTDSVRCVRDLQMHAAAYMPRTKRVWRGPCFPYARSRLGPKQLRRMNAGNCRDFLDKAGSGCAMECSTQKWFL